MQHPRQHPRPVAAAAVGALLAGLAGCSPATAENPAAAPPSTAAAAPTYLCRPENGGTPVPCDAEQYTELERIRVLTQEAERTFRAFVAESSALYRRGGTDEATPGLTATTGGPYLKAQLATYRRLAELKARVKGGDIKLVRLERSPGAEARGYEIALETCIDARSTEVVQDGKPATRGIAYAETVFFRRSEGILKAWDAVGEQVDGC